MFTDYNHQLSGVLLIPVEPYGLSVEMLIWKQAGSSDNSAERRIVQ